MPLEYGFDRIIEMCDEQIAETLGEAGDDGILGMSRGYYYMATKEITKGLSPWADNYGKRATYLAGLETDPAQKKDYEEITVVMHNIAHKKPDDYRDLMVRVAGFTQYWCEIGKPIQDEVIFRTEYDE